MHSGQRHIDFPPKRGASSQSGGLGQTIPGRHTHTHTSGKCTRRNSGTIILGTINEGDIPTIHKRPAVHTSNTYLENYIGDKQGRGAPKKNAGASVRQQEPTGDCGIADFPTPLQLTPEVGHFSRRRKLSLLCSLESVKPLGLTGCLFLRSLHKTVFFSS